MGLALQPCSQQVLSTHREECPEKVKGEGEEKGHTVSVGTEYDAFYLPHPVGLMKAHETQVH